jgi:predicted nucleic acid-binding protein
MAWIFEDEASIKADRLLGLIEQGASIIVPSIWRYETANMLLLAIKQKRISSFKTALSLLSRFPIKEDHFSSVATWGDTMHIATKSGLTIYEASYLETAKRNSIPLATFDKGMKRTAKSLKIPLIT